jgi:hypothetical protein
MLRWHGLIKGATALALAALAAGAAQLPATAAMRTSGSRAANSGAARPAAVRAEPATVRAEPAAVSSSWRARSIAKLSVQATNVTMDPQANAAYELLAGRHGAGPFRLERIALASKSVLKGPDFPVSGESLAGGYVWVSGAIFRGASSTFRLVLYQVNPATLRVVRSWRLTGERTTGLQNVPVTSGPAGTVWVGFERTLWRLNTTTGAIVSRARLQSGLAVTDVAVDPARAHLYVSAAPVLGGGAMREYSAAAGRLLASTTSSPLKFSVSGADLTAVPGGAWASFRTGMAGQTILLRQRGLRIVAFPGRSLFNWFMLGSTSYGGGSVWVGLNNGDAGCVAPTTGRVRSRGHLKLMAGGGDLLGVSAARHEVFALGQSDILAITAPAACWR